jgi:hypothetical protein
LVLSVSSGPGSPAPTSVSVIDGTIVTTGGSVSIPLNPGPDGAFSVSLPEGERAISITPGSIPPEISVDSFTYGAADLLKNPIRVALNDTAEMLILVTAVEIKPHSISGKVTGLLRTDGVRVVLQGGSLGTGVESPVAPDGAFAFADVLPGTYSLRLSLSGQIIQTSVRLGNIDLTGVTINFPRRFTIAAHVLVEGDAAKLAPVPRITLEARSATGTIARASEASTGSSPLAITVSDGEHRISVSNVPAGYAVKSVRYGTLDLQKEPIKVDGPITWEIVVRLVKNQP